MEKVVAVDPGVKATGIALFHDGKLTHVALVRAESIALMLDALHHVTWPEERFDSPDVVIVERPTVYRAGGKGDPNDLISVAIIAGGAAMTLGCETWTTTKFVEPRTWKGSTPKKIHNSRILNKLTVEESRVLGVRLDGVPDGLVHNVIDAIGVGLYELGRT